MATDRRGDPGASIVFPIMMTTVSPPKERRLRPRHGLADVHGNLLFSRTCRVLNLSGRGVAIETATPLAPGRSYAVKIEHDEKKISLNGTVAWCRLQGTHRNDEGEMVPVYVAGIELRNDLGENAEDVLPLLLEQGRLHLARRLPAHLTVRDTDATAPAIVYEVSRRGLSVESPCFPETGTRIDLRVEHDDTVLPVTARVTHIRSLEEREGQPWAAIVAEYDEMAEKDRQRLDRLIREESGLGPRTA